MPRLVLRLLALLAVTVAASAEVHEGTDANFKSLTRGPISLVHFYAPTCDECKSLDFAWAEAANTLKGVATFIRVDGSHQPALASEHNINDYPTIRVIRNRIWGKYGNYGLFQGLSVSEIVSFVKKDVTPAVTELTDQSSLDAFVKDAAPVAVILYTASKDDDGAVQFGIQAKDFKSAYCFAVRYREGPSRVVMHRLFDEPQVIYDGPLNSKTKFEAWLTLESFPLLGVVSRANWERYTEREMPLGWLFIDPRDVSANERAVAAVKGAAAALRTNISFLSIDMSDPVQAKIAMVKYGLSGTVLPAFAMERMRQVIFSPWPEDKVMDVAGITVFARSFVTDNERTAFSPTIARSAADGITTVVGSSFATIVQQATTDVFLQIYSPWCDHCTKFAPTFALLAAALRDEPTVTVAKLDASLNSVPKAFPIPIYPTLHFVPVGGRDPVMYAGDRTLKDLVAFVKKHSTQRLAVKDEL